MIGRFFIFLILSVSVSSVGNCESKFKWGVAPYYGSYLVKDPEGESKSGNEVFLLNFATSYDLGRDTRLWAEAGVIEFEVSPGVDSVSQKADVISISTSYQMRFRLSRFFQPWVGVGLSVNQAEYSNRYLVDSDGFFAREFENRSATETGIVLQLHHDFPVESMPFDLNVGFSYVDSFDDGLRGYRLHTGFMF